MSSFEGANRTAVERMISTRPMLIGLARASDVVPGLNPERLLHAGPPIEWEQASGPLRGALIGALILEGRATSEEEAVSLMERGEIELSPCHHHGVVGPMAGVTSSSMAVYVVEDAESNTRAFSTLNEGYGKVLRYGAYAPEVLERLAWMNSEMAEVLSAALDEHGPLDLRNLLAEALHMGDEGHNRNKSGSLLYLKSLAPAIVRVAAQVAGSDAAARVIDFLAGNALSVLNPVMAACKLMADRAHGIECSSLVSAMARNGTEFGIRVSGLGETWFTAPAQVPDGVYFAGFGSADANPDIGDSTITETAGIGAFAMAAAPAIVGFIGGTAEEALTATLEMYEITVAEHDYLTIPALGFRGTPVGIDVRRVVELGLTPRINTGIAHRDAGVGQIGAGLVRPPMSIFEQALEAFAERYLNDTALEED